MTWPAAHVLFLMVAGCGNTPTLGEPQRERELERAVGRAGNAAQDQARLRILKTLRGADDLEPELAADLDTLIAELERWSRGSRLDYFGPQVSRRKDYDFKIAANSSLQPLTWLYRGRMLTWYTLESGGVWNSPERRRDFLDRARGFFERAAQAFPENPIARMYLGEPIPASKRYPAVPGAPEWAVYQRESLERLTDIIEWWIDHRMQESSEYGGGWGDDCEMWRWWVPVLVGFDTPKISRAQARFSQALLSQPHMKLGYTTRMTDVEHTAEDSADAMTPMMHLDPDNPVWRTRALRLAELMQTLWTGRNERGFLQFKSTYFTVREVDTTPRRACDTVYHPRAVQPALLYWQRTGDRKLRELFSAWMDTWVDVARRAERGKPAGILPSAIHWPDGRVGGVEGEWWDPRNHGEYTLYLFPSAMSLMTHTLLLTFHMTGEARYLDPLRSMAHIRHEYLNSPPPSPPPSGTRAWCAARLSGLESVLAKYRFLTGNDDFDGLLAKEMSAYVRLRLTGNREALIRDLRNTVDALRVNFEGYTSEVRYTDRVLRFPTLYGKNGIYPEAISTIRQPNPRLLYSSVTGDPGDAGYFPLNAVRWLTPSRDLAALVTDAGRTGFGAELFHFGKEERPLAAELYLLHTGEYGLTLSVSARAGGGWALKESQDVNVSGPRTRIAVTLPAQRLCRLRVHPRS